MTLAKRLLLGTAAAFVATSGAHAADLGLPVAPSVDYVQICSIGSFTGFILPGGDVCFDISGYARGQLTWTEEIDPWTYGYGTATNPIQADNNTDLLVSAGNRLTSTWREAQVADIGDVTALINTAANRLIISNNLADAGNEMLIASTFTSVGNTLGYASSATGIIGIANGYNAFDLRDDLDNVIGTVGAGAGALQFGTAAPGLLWAGAATGDFVRGLEALNVVGNNDENDFTGNARINFDARTMTEYGLLRGFIRLDGENGGAANVDRAFVQLNVGSLGFTAGLADSVFDPVFTGYGSGAAQGLGLADQASTQFSVNAAVGNGVTVSLSVEDDDARTGSILGLRETDINVAGAAIVRGGLWTLSEIGYDAGASIPDFIASIRVDQAWGSAKLAAGLHEVNPASAGLGATSVDVASEYGYAISASAEFNIPVGVGSTFGVTGIYANGAQQFMGFNNEVGNSSTGFADAIVVTSRTAAGANVTALDLTTSYVVAAGFNFGLSSMVALSIDGSYADVDHHGSIFDGNVMTVRGGIAYTPVNNLTINAHVSYAASDFNTSALRTSVDEDEWGARFRVTRSF